MIIPYKNKIQVEMSDVKAGNFDTGVKTEVVKVLAISPEVQEIKVGDTLFVKAWAIDIIDDNGTKYNFVSADSDAICAIVREDVQPENPTS